MPVKRGCMRRRSVLLLAAMLAVGLGAARPAAADVASDHPAAILVFPKLIVNTTEGLDTVVRITNVSDTPLNVYCFYVNATPQCSLEEGTSCFPNHLACLGQIEGQTNPGICLSKWQETDFIIRLTGDQPTGWLVSGGERTGCRFINGVCSNDNTTTCRLDLPCATGHCILPPCLPLDGGDLGRTGPRNQTNEGAVPLSPEDPFIGELKCIAIDDAQQPVARNDLIGDVLIGRQQSGPEQEIEVEGYNAIGIPAVLNTCLPSGTCSQTGTPCERDVNCQSVNNRDATLVLGGPAATAEYEGCPNILVLDHYFDGAVDPVVTNFCRPDHTCSVSGTACANDNECVDNTCLGAPGGTCSVTGTPCDAQPDCDNSCILISNLCSLSGEHCLHDEDCTPAAFQTRVVTEVTLIPCTEDFKNQQPELSKTTVQFLVYNEFEQRFSSSTPVECFKEIRLSEIDAASPNSRSIFSAGVGGTLTGQTKIRGVQNDDPTVTRPHGNALLGVAEEFRCGGPKYQFPLCNFVDHPERVVSTNAKNLHFQGRRPTSDFIYLPGP